jgi:hypothetical protein
MVEESWSHVVGWTGAGHEGTMGATREERVERPHGPSGSTCEVGRLGARPIERSLPLWAKISENTREYFIVRLLYISIHTYILKSASKKLAIPRNT